MTSNKLEDAVRICLSENRGMYATPEIGERAQKQWLSRIFDEKEPWREKLLDAFRYKVLCKLQSLPESDNQPTQGEPPCS